MGQSHQEFMRHGDRGPGASGERFHGSSPRANEQFHRDEKLRGASPKTNAQFYHEEKLYGSQPSVDSRDDFYRSQPPMSVGKEDGGFGRRVRTGSNNFANGNNQNCGNMLTDVPSTRVLQAPGGRSNFTLG